MYHHQPERYASSVNYWRVLPSQLRNALRRGLFVMSRWLPLVTHWLLVMSSIAVLLSFFAFSLTLLSLF
jgi:hypothetical protein